MPWLPKTLARGLVVSEADVGAFKLGKAAMGRKPPLGNHGWISSPERRESARRSQSHNAGGRQVHTMRRHSETACDLYPTNPIQLLTQKIRRAFERRLHLLC